MTQMHEIGADQKLPNQMLPNQMLFIPVTTVFTLHRTEIYIYHINNF